MRSTPERWITIPRWDDFQHYKNRAPTWIKVYPRLLHDPEWLDLSNAQQGILLNLWMMYASNGREPISETRARQSLSSSQADARYFRGHIDSLNHAGFVGVSASKPLAQSKRKRDIEPKAVTSTQTPRDENGQPTRLTLEQLLHQAAGKEIR